MEQVRVPQGRLQYVDTARAMAIYMIVMAHVLRRGHVADFLSSTGVALFFFLSGYVYKWKEDRKAYWLGRLRRLYVPYLGVAVFSIVVYRFLGSFAAGKIGTKIKDTSIPRNLLAMLYANSKDHSMKWNETLWFIPCFLVVLLLANLAERVIRKILSNAPSAALRYQSLYGCQQNWDRHRAHDGIDKEMVLRILVCAVSLLLHSVITRHLHWHLPWQAETALGMLPVFEAGIMVRGIVRRIHSNDPQHGIPLHGIYKDLHRVHEMPVKSEQEVVNVEQKNLHRVHGMPARSEQGVVNVEQKTGGQQTHALSAEGSGAGGYRGIVLLAAGLLLVAVEILLTVWNGQISIRTDKFPRDLVSYVVLAFGIAGFLLLASVLPAWKSVMYAGQKSLDIMLWNKFPVLAVQTVLPVLIPGFTSLFLEQDTAVGACIAACLTLPCIVLCLVWAWILHRLHRH